MDGSLAFSLNSQSILTYLLASLAVIVLLVVRYVDFSPFVCTMFPRPVENGSAVQDYLLAATEWKFDYPCLSF